MVSRQRPTPEAPVTARYGLPDHLLAPVALAVKIAWDGARKGKPDWTEEVNGTPVHTVKALWSVRVLPGHEWHADLLTPAYAQELLRVVESGIEINARKITDVGNACFDPDFPAHLELDLRAEEIVASLQEIAVSVFV